MNTLQINTDPSAEYQRQVFNLPLGSDTKRVIFELRYLYATDKWYASFFEAQSGDPICTYIPLIASTENFFNNLLEQFSYKNIGWMVCWPVVDEPSSDNPTKNNLSEFALIWGDSFE